MSDAATKSPSSLSPNAARSPSSLSPPASRHRASSTNVCPPLTLKSLGRRRSSILQPLAPSPEPSPPPPLAPPPSMLVVVVSRLLEILHVNPKHPVSWSAPSTPRSSTDDLVLPMSASSHQTSFGELLSEKEPSKPQSAYSWWPSFPAIRAPILFVLMLFPLSTALVLFGLSTLPIPMSWPRTLADLAQIGRELHGYSQSGPWPMAHVIGVMSMTAVWKHAWSVPGSVIWNVLAGALFSPVFATLLLTMLTTIGSLCATLLAMPLAPLLTHAFPRALDLTRSALEGDSDSTADPEKPKSSAWVRLTVLRLIGVVPWSGLNIACGVCMVPLADCFLGSFIGSLPWTAVTCQIGDILQTVASTPSPTPQTVSSLLASPEILAKLAFLSFLSLAPILARDRLRTLISHSAASASAAASDERAPRWAWVRDWRAKLPSRSRSRQTAHAQLAVLIREKEDLPS